MGYKIGLTVTVSVCVCVQFILGAKAVFAFSDVLTTG